MRIFKYPEKEDYSKIIKRLSINDEDIREKVKPIIEQVKNRGDQAVIEFTTKFDKVQLEKTFLDENELIKASSDCSDKLKASIDVAFNNIKKFHNSQKESIKRIETIEGVECWRKSLPIEKVGLYIPGGSAPLLSSLLMLGIPARLAGCKEIVVCSPPQKDGSINAAIAYIALKLNLKRLFLLGGAQAIAAMAHGTETVPKVYKLFGPGNQFVTAAKQLVTADGLAIDMPAGPSEVCLIADKSANPQWVAADLLSQCEHGADSSVLLLTTDEKLLNSVIRESEHQLDYLPRKEQAATALDNSAFVLCRSEEECAEISNLYGPEHLILSMANAEAFSEKITAAGSVFLGYYSCESAGDYASGTNHTLPTNGYAHNHSGVSLDSFINKVTFQKITREGALKLGPIVEELAIAEGLEAHRKAMALRYS